MYCAAHYTIIKNYVSGNIIIMLLCIRLSVTISAHTGNIITMDECMISISIIISMIKTHPFLLLSHYRT